MLDSGSFAGVSVFRLDVPTVVHPGVAVSEDLVSMEVPGFCGSGKEGPNPGDLLAIHRLWVKPRYLTTDFHHGENCVVDFPLNVSGFFIFNREALTLSGCVPCGACRAAAIPSATALAMSAARVLVGTSRLWGRV
jgi:hypothetical protein